jgi:uncharacterized membrane protein
MNQPSTIAAPSPDETTMAMLANVLQIFTWWIGPLVIYLARRESKFVSFHAMQALLWQLTMMCFGMVLGLAWMIFIFLNVFPHLAKNPSTNHAPPAALFVLFPVVWLGFMGFWATNVIIGIVFGIKAGRGEWASYPVLGRFAHRIVGQ